jgi:hypothetical protein
VKKAMLPLAVAVLVMYSGTALATHPHPQGASPAYISLVPAYKQCTTPNATHGSPLAFPSCRPPVPSSPNVTFGTADSNGAAANSIGHIKYTVKAASPEDVVVTLSISDLRCTPSTGAGVCALSNAQDGPDYSGNIQAVVLSRISDHLNGPSLTEAATMVDIPFPVNAACANTASTSIGGLCTVGTSFNAIIPGAVQDNQRTNWELGQVRVEDGGADGSVSTAPNDLLAIEGTFVP